MQIAELSNPQLLASLRTVVGDERRLVATVLAHLAEVEERRLHLELACSSLFDFCVRHLRLSEDQACRRITVARLGRRYPQLLDAIARGDMHLSGVHQLREHFTEANVDELIAAASGKSRAEIDRLIARIAPKPDVPESIRKIPEQATLAPSVVTPPPETPAPRVVPQVLPLSEERYRVTFTASAVLREKIEHARVLLRRCTSDDLAVILERALDLLIAQLEKEKRGKADRPRRSKGAADPADVTRETRREVFERDGSQCSFVSADGERCPARELLELDHRQPRARGGLGDAANIRVLCKAHNQLAAERAFGRAHMDAKRRRTKRSTTTAPEQTTNESRPLVETDSVASKKMDAATTDNPQRRLEADAVTPKAHAATADVASAAIDPHHRGNRAATADDAEPYRGAAALETVEHPHRCGDDVEADDPQRHGRGVGVAETLGGAASANGTERSRDPRPPHEVVRCGLIKLGFRSKDADRALAELPLAVWSEPLESILRAALARLT